MVSSLPFASVGSGLILLVIVGAWLAVLVPMALRSHDASNLGTVDKFHDAMRVLSRREGVRKDAPEEDEDVPVERSTRLPSRAEVHGLGARAVSRVVRQDRADRPGLTPAARRRRALAVVVTVAVATLVGALVGPLWLLVPHAVADLLLLGFLVWLRKQAVLRAEREWRAAMAERRPARRPAPAPTASLSVRMSVPARVAGIPERLPSRAAVLGQDAGPLAVPAARYEGAAPVPARGAQGEPWQPVPVPVPTYVTAPTAPRRVLDLTHSGQHAEGLADAERSLGIDDQGPELDEILDRRRAVGD